MNYKRQAKAVLDYIANEYGVEPEFLWPEQSPNFCVFRNARNKKWFGIIMVIPGTKLGLETEAEVEIIDLRFDKGQALDFATSNENIFPGWHMNKRNWITLVLDDRMSDEAVFGLVDKSFGVVDGGHLGSSA